MKFAHVRVPNDPKDNLGNLIIIFNLRVLDMVNIWEY